MTNPFTAPASGRANESGPRAIPAPGSCPRCVVRSALGIPSSPDRWARFADFHREPFRLFFPVATLAGIIGVGLWPLMLLGWMEVYPGPSHARLMAQGFFGGFVIGFMGTAMPRMVGALPFSAPEAFALLTLLLANITANIANWIALGDMLFIVELSFLFWLLRRRCHSGKEVPPPSFVLVGLGFASAIVGTAMHLVGKQWELSPSLESLARSFAYHGFVLLCILGAGGFLLPRFLGLGVRRRYPESGEASAEWNRAARYARLAGGLILLTYILEFFGWPRVSGTARALLICAYVAYEMPVEKLRWNWRGVHCLLIVGLVSIPLGVLVAGWMPAMRATLLHLELVAGFALITLGVATRVVFGHSGAQYRLERFNLGLAAATILILLGLASRVSGDFLPGIQTTHYLYGAGCWIAGCILWAAFVLPRVLRPDPEG